MHRLRHLLALPLTLAGLVAPVEADARVVHRPDLARHFADAGTRGTMVVQRHGRRPATVVVGARRSHRRYLPSSTFKIPNALLALDRGVVDGPRHPFPGPNPNYLVDGVPLLPATCEGDLDLATAFASSCIPIFQRLARRLGHASYARAVRLLRYGNRRVRAAPVDTFWLEGPFGISAAEQADFLERLRRDALPASARAMADVRTMMLVERGSGTTVRAKTGYVFTTTPRVGWWVGWVEHGRDVWTFALNLDVTAPSHLAARAAIGRAILADLGAPVR